VGSFVVRTLGSTSCSAEIPLRRVHIIVAILDGAPINVGELIANNIYVIASKNWKVVAHSSLIFWLCEEANVDFYSNDLDASMMKPITDKIMDGFVKDYEEFIMKLLAQEAS
jgi:hypothetical protein